MLAGRKGHGAPWDMVGGGVWGWGEVSLCGSGLFLRGEIETLNNINKAS